MFHSTIIGTIVGSLRIGQTFSAVTKIKRFYQMANDLDVILSEGESFTVEFKESADKSLSSEVCAFANASGGRVFIGVDDCGRAVGTDVSNEARSRVQDMINQIDPHLKVEIEVLDNIIIVTVPEGTNKPYSCSKGFCLRSGSNSQKLTREVSLSFSRAKAALDTMKSSAKTCQFQRGSMKKLTHDMSGSPR
ncbi:MAG: putative DNA binding domain-containing protein [Deltaproteobacteria bacterium]|jgi:predicted HTH transcriptional regulator|nr:putative DNA binding domain-containing protein [Deltaproteobacteria bacterium]